MSLEDKSAVQGLVQNLQFVFMLISINYDSLTKDCDSFNDVFVFILPFLCSNNYPINVF